jgi:hypothetical protein
LKLGEEAGSTRAFCEADMGHCKDRKQLRDALRTNERRRRCLKLGGEAGSTRAFCEAVDTFLVDMGHCKDRKQLRDNETKKSNVQDVIGHRAHSHAETLRWTIDSAIAGNAF